MQPLNVPAKEKSKIHWGSFFMGVVSFLALCFILFIVYCWGRRDEKANQETDKKLADNSDVSKVSYLPPVAPALLINNVSVNIQLNTSKPEPLKEVLQESNNSISDNKKDIPAKPELDPAPLKAIGSEIPDTITSPPELKKPETPKNWHSDDFRTVCINGKRFELSLNKARIVERAWKYYENDIREVHQSKLLEDTEINSKRLRDVFKDDLKAFKGIFVKGRHKGTFRLALP